MRNSCLLIFAVSVGLQLVMCSGGTAQEPTTPALESGADSTANNSLDKDQAPTPREAPLPILLQTNKAGVLTPTPLFAPTDEGDLRQHVMTWADIDRLLDRGADQQGPRITCRKMVLSGAVHGGRATLEVELTYLTSPHRWIRAPVGFGNAVVSRFESSTGGFLDFDEKEGFLFWMPPAPPAKASATPKPEPAEETPATDPESMMPVMPARELVERKLKIYFSFAVTESGPEKRISLRTPRAPTSHLDLVVDTPDAQATIFPSDASITTQPASTGGTQITANGIGGDLVITWRPRRSSPATPAPILESQAIIEVYIDADERIEATARLTVRSLSEPFQAFTVHLPPGMRLSPVQSAEYEVSVTDPPQTPPRGAQQTALIRMRQPTIGPVTVRLETASSPQSQESSFIEVGGFDVVEAVEQWGHVLLISAGSQSVSWVESPNIVQVDNAPPPVRRVEEVAAQFKFFAQPFSLQIKAAPKKTRVRVEPTYALEIFSDYLRLTAVLKYQIHGAKASLVRVDLQGWELESVGGDDVVNRDGIKFDRLAPLEIPFRTSVSGEVTVRITARRIMEGAQGSLRVPLPSPVADFVVSALVGVAPNRNIELTPLLDQSHGLLPEPQASAEGLFPGRKATFIYRTRAGEPQPVFVADYEVKTGSITVDAEADIRVRERTAMVRQTFSYTFAYEPAERLLLEVPRALYEQGEIYVLFDGEPLIPKPAEPGATEDRALLRFEPSMPLGRHALTVEFATPLPELSLDQDVPVLLPLATPVFEHAAPEVAKIESNVVRVAYTIPLQVSPDKSAWRLQSPAGPPDSIAAKELVFIADGPMRDLPLLVTRDQPENQFVNTIERLWLQTWLTSTYRRDHAAFQLITSESRFRVRLPQGTDWGSLVVFVNGRRLRANEHFLVSGFRPGEAANREVSVVTLDLTPFASPTYSIELWYGFFDPRDRKVKLELDAPELLGVGWIHHVYWQLMFPDNEHVVAAPHGLTSEQEWRRGGAFWVRKPTLGQRDLEQWSGASEQPIPESVNVYLYSTFGNPRRLEVYTISRSIAVLGLSGLVLIVGLGFLRNPRRLQTRWLAETALLAAVVVAAAVIALPEIALLAGQCAIAGLLCVTIAWCLMRINPGGAGTVSVLGASSVQRRAALPPLNASLDGHSSRATTAARAASVPASSVESTS